MVGELCRSNAQQKPERWNADFNLKMCHSNLFVGWVGKKTSFSAFIAVEFVYATINPHHGMLFEMVKERRVKRGLLDSTRRLPLLLSSWSLDCFQIHPKRTSPLWLGRPLICARANSQTNRAHRNFLVKIHTPHTTFFMRFSLIFISTEKASHTASTESARGTFASVKINLFWFKRWKKLPWKSKEKNWIMCFSVDTPGNEQERSREGEQIKRIRS